jgi:hypothetical protein
MARSVIHKVRKRNVHDRGRKFDEQSDMIVGSRASIVIRICAQFDIDAFIRHARCTKRKRWHACGMSNKNERISMCVGHIVEALLKCWMLHREGTIWLNTNLIAERRRYIRNVVGLANKYSRQWNVYPCKRKRFYCYFFSAILTRFLEYNVSLTSCYILRWCSFKNRTFQLTMVVNLCTTTPILEF